MRRNARRGFDTLFAEDRLSNERRGFVDGGSSCNEAVISIGHEPGNLGLKRGVRRRRGWSRPKRSIFFDPC